MESLQDEISSHDLASEPPDDDILEIDPTGRYVRHKELLGKGAFKTVYKAFDQVDGIEVAWNQVRIDEVVQSSAHLERLHSEVHLLKSLKHKNIIKFYNSWVDDRNKTVNIITELFTSGSLRRYRIKHKKVDIKVFKRWARQILMGLHYLHSHNPPIIHRDVKCDNIFINGNHGEVKIGDLGLATIMQQANKRSVIGTPEFMAPELYNEDYNELVDIYAFGMCLLEMVTFEYPYSECQNPAQIYKKVSSGVKPAALSKVKDLEVKQFIEKCLVPAANRLSAKELLEDPFLHDEFIGYRTIQISSTVTPKLESPEEHNFSLKMPNCMYMDADDYIPPVITFVDNPSNGGFMVCLKFQKVKGKQLMVTGERTDENSVSLMIPFEDQNGHTQVTNFSFDPGNDTSLSVAREMVEELKLSDQYLMSIAQLIELSLLNLVPDWKPCIPIDHPLALNGIQTNEAPNVNCQMQQDKGSSVISFYNLFESFDLTNSSHCLDSNCIGELVQPMHEAPNSVKLDEFMSGAAFGSQSTTITEDRGSMMSYVSGISYDENCRKHYLITCLNDDKAFHEYGVYGMKEVQGTLSGVEIGTCYNDKDMGVNTDMQTLSSYPSNASSLVIDEDDENHQLRLELEKIEFQNQQALKEISMKRHESIVAAKQRFSQKKVVSIH